MSEDALSRHTIYNNRFRTPSFSSGRGPAEDSDNALDFGEAKAHHPFSSLPLHRQPQPLQVIQEAADPPPQRRLQLDLFGQTPLEWAVVGARATAESPLPLSPQSPADESRRGGDFYLRLHSSERAAGQAAAQLGEVDLNFRPPAPPAAPGKPRRISRGSNGSSSNSNATAAAGRRQQFASSRYSTNSNSSLCGTGVVVGGGCGSSIDGKRIVTSMDSTLDEVFADPLHEGCGHQRPPLGSPGGDWSLFPQPAGGHVRRQMTSTSSTASMLPNPYNSFNHRLHSCLWCCNCLYFVFFCCLPAIHYMEQSDLQHRNNNPKAARRSGAASTFLFLLGTLIALAVFGLVFFLIIYFAVH